MKTLCLGIWAQEEDSDDDNKRPSFSKRLVVFIYFYMKFSKKPDYTKGVSFVSGGIKVGEKVVNQDGSEQSTSTVTFLEDASKHSLSQ